MRENLSVHEGDYSLGFANISAEVSIRTIMKEMV